MTRKRGRPPHPDLLTPAEWRVLHATRHGLSNSGMARRMGLSVNAIKYHLRNILEKTGLPDKQALRLYPGQPRDGRVALTANRESTMNASSGPRSLGQISRTVRDVEASRNWYELVLELPHLYSFGTMAFFDCDGTRLLLNQAEEFNPNESILYFRVDDIEASHRGLEAKGVGFIAAPHRIHRHENGDEEWMAFFRDPDQRPLALMALRRPAG